MKTVSSDIESNNLCPLCRHPMFEHTDEDDDESDADEEEISIHASIISITRRLCSHGVTMADMVAVYLQYEHDNDPDYSIDRTDAVEIKITDIVDEITNEAVEIHNKKQKPDQESHIIDIDNDSDIWEDLDSDDDNEWEDIECVSLNTPIVTKDIRIMIRESLARSVWSV